MVVLGLLVGLATGGILGTLSRTVQEVALIVAMTFSLTEISLRNVAPRAEIRGFVLATAMTYGALSGLVLLFAALSPDPGLRAGWVLMAAVPPAVAVIPITSFLRGNVRNALISDAMLYLIGLATVPLVTYAALGQAAPVGDLAVQTLLLIGVPLLVSQPLRRIGRAVRFRAGVVSLSFFVLVLAIVGSARDALIARLDLLATLSVESFLRTFALGTAVLLIGRAVRASRETVVAATTFASFKNLGLTVVLAFSFFGSQATLPSIVSLVFEILWMATLPVLLRPTAMRRTRISER